MIEQFNAVVFEGGFEAKDDVGFGERGEVVLVRSQAERTLQRLCSRADLRPRIMWDLGREGR